MQPYYADIRNEKEEPLVSNFSVTMFVNTSCNGFPVLEFSFKDQNELNRGDLWFHYDSLVTAETSIVTSNDFRNHSDVPSFDKASFQKMTLQYCFAKTKNTKIGSDVDFKLLLEHLKSEKSLTIYSVLQNDCSDLSIPEILPIVKREKAGTLLDQYYERHGCRRHRLKSIVSMADRMCMNDVFKPIAARNSFDNKSHYLITQAVACQLEQSIVNEKVERFCRRVQKVLIAEVEEGNSRNYRVFLPPPLNNESKIQPGDRIQVNLPGRHNVDKPWVATILPELVETPQGYLEAHMSRPWKLGCSPTTNVVYDDYKIFNVRGAKKLDMSKLDIEHDGTHVSINLLVHDALLMRRQKCMEYMHASQHDDELTKAIEKVLIAQSLHDLPTFDIFHKLRDEFEGNPEGQITGLNKGQQLAVDSCKTAPAGIVAVQGPPGTGKTHLIVRITTPYIMSQAERKVLVTTQTNIGTDNLALLCQQHIDDLRHKNPTCAQLGAKYVVRAHVSDAEIKNYTNNKRATSMATTHPTGLRTSVKPTTPAGSVHTNGPSADQREAMTLLEIGCRMASLHVSDDDPPPQAQVSDERVEALNKLSLGVRMLEMADILPTGPKPVRRNMFAKFRLGYERWSKAALMDKDELKWLWQTTDELRRYVLLNATIVCTTITNTASDAMMRSLSGTTDLIIADEMPRCLEVDALLLFMGRINPDGYIMVGDPDQLGPYVESKEHENPLGDQLRLSVQERLRNVGFPFVFLSEQYRMSPELSRVPNRLVYGKRLQDSQKVLGRLLTTQIIGFNNRKFGIRSNHILLDLPADTNIKSSSTKQGRNFSRFNEHHVMYCVNLAVEISERFPQATIAVLTPYQNQYFLFLSAKQRMKNAGFKTHENIRFQKVDAAQGLEFDFVILDNLFLDRCDSGSAGFMRDRKRLNVATTRARHGMYIVADMEVYHKIPNSNAGYGSKHDNDNVHAYMGEWARHTYEVDTTGLVCEYYVPGSAKYGMLEERED